MYVCTYLSGTVVYVYTYASVYVCMFSPICMYVCMHGCNDVCTCHTHVFSKPKDLSAVGRWLAGQMWARR